MFPRDRYATKWALSTARQKSATHLACSEVLLQLENLDRLEIFLIPASPKQQQNIQAKSELAMARSILDFSTSRSNKF
ncbi:hypothetical protein [Microcoleus sp. B4-D4]|uniref:hypothetical protein n=1 Tax=Microcoleus sp. B4-D4 TaxID=2818667 RepID=UPI002FD36678